MKNEPKHNFSLPDWKEKYTRPPKKENQNIRISAGPARGHFSSHSGGFGGNRTWSVSVMASAVSGVKDKGRAAAFAEYIERPEECLSAAGDPEAKRKFAEIENKLLSENPKRVTQRRLIVPVPTEFLKNPDKNMQKFAAEFVKKYFEPCAVWNMALHAGGEDLKNPHIHIIYSPVDIAGKNIRDYNQKTFLEDVKKDVGIFITRELGIPAVVKEYKKNKAKGAIKHYPKWIANAYKRAEAAELAGDGGAMKKDYAARYPVFREYLDERGRKKAEKKINDLESREKVLSKQFAAFADKNKKIFDKINGAEEAEIKNKIAKIKQKVKKAMDLEPLKNIDVADLAEKLGFERDSKDKKAYRRGDIKVSIDEKAGKFNSFTNPDVKGRGSIDFVMANENKSFKGAIEFLSAEYNVSSSKPAKPAFFQPVKQEIPKEPEKKILELPAKAENTEKLKTYLVGKRKIHIKIVEKLLNNNFIYQDKAGNVVFVSRDMADKPAGAELKSENFKGLVKGSSRDTGAFQMRTSGSGDKKLVITESAIDAISYFSQKIPVNSTIISTSGVMPHTTKFVDDYIQKQDIKKVIIAYDNDNAGRTNAESLKTDLKTKYPDLSVEIERSKGKDWNEDLQNREIERELQQAQELKLKQQQKIVNQFVNQNQNKKGFGRD